MQVATDVAIPALVSLAVAAISHPLVVRMKNNHDERILLREVRAKKLHEWKVYVSNLLFEFPRYIREFRNDITYLDIETELPAELKKRVEHLVMNSNYLTEPSQGHYQKNLAEIKVTLVEVSKFLAKLGRTWKVQ